MYTLRGKTRSGKSVTGQSDAATPHEAIKAAHDAAKKAGDELTQISAKQVEGSAGIKIAQPRKRKSK